MRERALFNEKRYFIKRGVAVVVLCIHREDSDPRKPLLPQILRLENMVFNSLVAAGRIMVFTEQT